MKIIKQPTTSNDTCPASLHRKITPKSEREALVAKWQQSDLTKIEFCRANNIEPKNFYNWSQGLTNNKLKSSPAAVKPAQMLPAKVVGTAQQSSSGVIEILIGSSIKLRLPAASKSDYILSLIKGLACN